MAKESSFFALYDEDIARADIQAARNQGARCVIVCLYWSRQDITSVTTAQKKTALSLAEMGADIILGTRPSRVLPMSWLSCTGPDGKNHTAFVAYSLGTLLTESREAFDISGLLLHLNVRSDEQGGLDARRADDAVGVLARRGRESPRRGRSHCRISKGRLTPADGLRLVSG